MPGRNSTGMASVLFGRRNVEGGNRTGRPDAYVLPHRDRQQGQLTDNLSYNIYAQEGLTLRADQFTNDVSKSRWRTPWRCSRPANRRASSARSMRTVRIGRPDACRTTSGAPAPG